MPNTLSFRLLLVALLLPPVVSAELTITGVDQQLERNVRAFAAIASEPCDADDRLIRRRFGSKDRNSTSIAWAMPLCSRQRKTQGRF